MRLRRIISTAAALSIGLVGLVLASPAQAVVLNCGDVLSTPNQTVVLTADVGPCTTTFGIAIIADNVTLDLNGHTVRGDGPQPGDITATWGIYVTSVTGSTANGVTVKNGTVTAFNTGIYHEIVNQGTVDAVQLLDNIGPDSSGIFGEGYQSFQGGSHTVKNSRVDHNGPFAGIVAFDNSNNTITSNQVTNNNILAGNIMQDIGIWIVNLSPSNPAKGINNTVTSNQVSGNGLDGIQIARFTNTNTVTSNSVTNNGFGQVPPFRDGTGIAIFGNSNVVQQNQSSFNGGNGIGVFRAVNSQGVPVGGQNNTIRQNSAIGNGSAPNSVAFDGNDTNLTPPCDNNTWTQNQLGTRNQPCVQ